MSLPIIVVVNRSTLATMADLNAAVAAIQRQISGEFSAAWELEATLAAVGPDDTTPPGAWLIYLEDVSSQPGALGFHEDESIPSGYVGVKTCQDDGVSWTSCLSHECLEMLADPMAQLCCQMGDRVEALEVADACESVTYTIAGIEVSDFLLPNWFRPGSAPPYDHLGVLQAPGAIAPGGYHMSAPLGPWSQENAAHARASKQAPVAYSRRGRRIARYKTIVRPDDEITKVGG